jgi:hypothetical protein
MKIQDGSIRDCCQGRDILSPSIEGEARFFCRWCGKEFKEERYCDAAGDTDTRFIPVKCNKKEEEEQIKIATEEIFKSAKEFASKLDLSSYCENDKLIEVNSLFEEIFLSVKKLFEIKNKQYGNHFLDLSRVRMYQEVQRKNSRYKNLFKETNDSIITTGDWTTLIPTMVDNINYNIMCIINEIEKLKFEKEETKEEFLNWLSEEIIKGSDKIDVISKHKELEMKK